MIEVIPDKHFHREGSDIITEEEITFPQAVLGSQIEVHTVDDKIKIRISSGTQPGTLIRLSGKGMPKIRSTSRGDHYVKIKIAIPKHVYKTAKRIIGRIRQPEQSL